MAIEIAATQTKSACADFVITGYLARIWDENATEKAMRSRPHPQNPPSPSYM
ncbi:MAG: hypothetical protein RIG63_30685 [Coleofasciculus chthonoplastes F3-SA18-01]